MGISILIAINLIWIAYSLLEGLREGFYWHFKVNSRRECKFEIHPIFSLQRGLVLSIMCGLMFYTFGWYSVINTVSMMLMFSFFHNGSYYCTRHKLDDKLYPKEWRDQSTTSTAKMTKIMTYRNRTIFMLIGLTAQIFTYIFLIK